MVVAAGRHHARQVRQAWEKVDKLAVSQRESQHSNLDYTASFGGGGVAGDASEVVGWFSQVQGRLSSPTALPLPAAYLSSMNLARARAKASGEGRVGGGGKKKFGRSKISLRLRALLLLLFWPSLSSRR